MKQVVRHCTAQRRIESDRVRFFWSFGVGLRRGEVESMCNLASEKGLVETCVFSNTAALPRSLDSRKVDIRRGHFEKAQFVFFESF